MYWWGVPRGPGRWRVRCYDCKLTVPMLATAQRTRRVQVKRSADSGFNEGFLSDYWMEGMAMDPEEDRLRRQRRASAV